MKNRSNTICDCGNKATVPTQGQMICERCARIESRMSRYTPISMKSREPVSRPSTFDFSYRVPGVQYKQL